MNGDCPAVEFRIEAAATQHDRLYPGSFPFGDGVIAHTGYLALDESCGATTWRFAADAGHVVQQGVDHGPVYEPGLDGESVDDAYVLLTRSARFSRLGPLQVVAAPAVGDTTLTLVASALDRATRVLAEAQGQGWSTPATVMVTQDQGSPQTVFHGDVTRRGMVRLSFFDATRGVDASMAATVTGFVAHELTHLLQPDWVGQDAWLSEGGAELERLSVAAAAPRSSQGDAGAEPIGRAINDCLLAIGDSRPGASAAVTGGSTPYACGLAFHALWLAGTHDGHVRLRDLFDEYRVPGNRTPPLLDARRAFDSASLERAVHRSRWFAGRRAWDEREQRQILSATLTAFMSQRCSGGFGVRTDARGITLDAPSCEQFPDGARLVRINGADVDAPALAAQRLADACSRDGTVVLVFDSGIGSAHACSPLAYAPPQQALVIREPEIEIGLRTTRPAAPRRPPSSTGSRAAR